MDLYLMTRNLLFIDLMTFKRLTRKSHKQAQSTPQGPLRFHFLRQMELRCVVPLKKFFVCVQYLQQGEGDNVSSQL